jgi:hypothetical protein
MFRLLALLLLFREVPGSNLGSETILTEGFCGDIPSCAANHVRVSVASDISKQSVDGQMLLKLVGLPAFIPTVLYRRILFHNKKLQPVYHVEQSLCSKYFTYIFTELLPLLRVKNTNYFLFE